MNKKEFVNTLAQRMRLSQRYSERLVDTFLQIISETLSDDDRVQFVGFGTFEVKSTAPRIGRNPKTNTIVNIPSRRVPVFKPGKTLKSAVSSLK